MADDKRSSSWIRTDKRHALYLRDGATCAYCGCDVVTGAHVSVPRAATLDHLLAHHLGGGNEASNLVTACVGCNASKADKTMRQWYAELRTRGIDTKAVQAEVRRRTGRNLAPYRAAAKAAMDAA